MTKPGIKTSEFWMHLGLQIVFLLNTVNAWSYMPPKYTIFAQTILGAMYAGSRGLAKLSTPTVNAGVIAPTDEGVN